MRNRLIVLLSLVFVLCTNANAEVFNSTLTKSSKVSLLTCSPSDEAIYALFGHLGLRVKDDSLKIDYVFDYGLFDFESDHFIFRFVKGETDYMVGARSFNRLLFEYDYRSMGVIEQVLNLTLEERQRVFDALIDNSLPENRIYRYNFFYDNCATRPRDIIAENITGKIEYTQYSKDQTYRDLLEECLVLTPWSRFGINLVIGSGADKIITERQKDFLPAYLFEAFTWASISIEDENISRLLVSSSEELLHPKNGPLKLVEAIETGTKATDFPFIVGIALLLVGIIISYLSLFSKRRVLCKIFDCLLFSIAGIAGSIIFFLMFFSEHPCVDANWNLVWLNPLALLIVPFFFVKSFTKYVISYHFVNFVALTLFLVGIMFIPQKIDIAFIPYILVLWLRSGINILQYKLKK